MGEKIHVTTGNPLQKRMHVMAFGPEALTTHYIKCFND